MAGVSAQRVVARAFERPELRERLIERPVHVLAVGKAAAAMATAFLASGHVDVRTALAIGTHAADGMPEALTFMAADHPFPDDRSQQAARAALARAAAVRNDEHLVLLISGGASALMCDADEGLTFADKIAATRTCMLAGADIHQLNAIRKHLSRVKGGRLAAACAGTSTTLALSDVVGDDLSVIGSGPGLPDATTWLDVHTIVSTLGVETALPDVIRRRIADGCEGSVADTPKAGDPALARASGVVVGRAADAVAAAAEAARRLGYDVRVIERRITGEARDVAVEWLHEARAAAATCAGPACVLSSGETTVKVTGDGLGGRNLEFALALAEPLAGQRGVAAASIGTDGIDGTSGVAGAWVSGDTLQRARTAGLPSVADVLARNDSFRFFEPLGDTMRIGRTDTNVGDIQVLLEHP